MQDLPTGGRTPLAHGIYLALETLETERRKDRDVLPAAGLAHRRAGQHNLGRRRIPIRTRAGRRSEPTGAAGSRRPRSRR